MQNSPIHEPWRSSYEAQEALKRRVHVMRRNNIYISREHSPFCLRYVSILHHNIYVMRISPKAGLASCGATPRNNSKIITDPVIIGQIYNVIVKFNIVG